MSNMPSQPTNAGIVTDESSGERHIPESTRADGSTRKAIKIRPGYRPPEDVEVYKNRTAENFRTRRGNVGVPGAEGLKDDAATGGSSASASNNKNAKRREARKRAKAAAEDEAESSTSAAADAGASPSTAAPTSAASKSTGASKQPDEDADAEAEKDKKVRNLKKKLRQAKELKDKKDGGQSLLPEQIAKVIKINEIIRELDALGFDAEGEPKESKGEAEKTGD